MRDPFDLGVIRPSDAYTLTEFRKRVGLSEGALRQARRAGLRVIYAHRRGYVMGADWIDYLHSLCPVQHDAHNEAPGRGQASK